MVGAIPSCQLTLSVSMMLTIHNNVRFSPPDDRTLGVRPVKTQQQEGSYGPSTYFDPRTSS